MAGEGDGLTDVLHLVGDGTHLAFRYLAPRQDEEMDPARAVLLDGGRPFRGDPVICGTCGEHVRTFELEPVRWAD